MWTHYVPGIHAHGEGTETTEDRVIGTLISLMRIHAAGADEHGNETEYTNVEATDGGSVKVTTRYDGSGTTIIVDPARRTMTTYYTS